MKFLVILSWALVALAAPQDRRPRPSRPARPSPTREPPSPPGPPSGGSCDAAEILDLTQPIAPMPLPVPGDGNVLAAIVVGRGVQNYTCGADSIAAPIQLGAVATLYEVSCAAAANPDLLSTISQEAFAVPFTPGSPGPRNLPCASGLLRHAGEHFFTASGVPTFDLTDDNGLGITMVSKGKTSPAPPADNAVAWLELLKAEGTTGPVTKMFRLKTVGGTPPATCAGQPPVVSVQYAAQYWVYTGVI